MKSLFRLVVVSAISCPWAYPALAQFGSLAIDSCDDYVARATSQVQIATGCNFGGPRWSLELRGTHELVQACALEGPWSGV